MYFLKRLLLIFPTFFCIICINFFVIHYAPGNPVTEILTQEDPAFNNKNPFKTSVLDEKIVQKLKHDFELDQPIYKRFFNMMKRYLMFDFGYSYFKGKSVKSLIAEKLPISLSLGFLGTFFTYLIAVPLGMLKAVGARTKFDWISTVILGGLYAIPPFATAVALIIWLGNYVPIYAVGGGATTLWHLILPLTALVLYNLAKPTILMKNSLLEELSKPYVLLVRAKGASESYILWRHCFKSAFLVTISSFSYVFLFMFFFGTLVIEFLFSLDGLGYLSFEATTHRDYPVILGCLYTYAFFGIICHIFTDWFYSILDKRVNLDQP
jgi:microcin C transport system permease protein